MLGNLPVFKISEVSLVDIEMLIDIGMRFELKDELPEDAQFDDLERYLKDGKNRLRVRSCNKRSAKNYL